MIEIENKNIWLKISPDLGGALIDFIYKPRTELSIFRKTPQIIQSARETSLFILAPYSNRVKGDQFEYNSKTYHLPIPSIHGILWGQKLKVVSYDKTRLSLFFSTSSNEKYQDYPFSFDILVTYTLLENGFNLDLKLKNTAQTSFIFGFGLHPYFNKNILGREKNQNVELCFESLSSYLTRNNLPIGETCKTEYVQKFNQGMRLTNHIDNCFNSWMKIASLTWIESNFQMNMKASGDFSHLQVFYHKEHQHIAIEPVSHCVDGFNRFNHGFLDTGIKVLKNNDVMQASCDFSFVTLE